MKSNRSLPILEDFQAFRPRRASSARVPSRAAVVKAPTLSRGQRRLSWACQIVAAAIMMETLFFKFTGAPESIYIFSKMSMEPWWRYGQGIWELLASLCLLWPGAIWAGGVLTLGAIGAALVSHLTVLGIQVQGDGGLLFVMAVASFLAGLIVTVLHREAIPFLTPMDA